MRFCLLFTLALVAAQVCYADPVTWNFTGTVSWVLNHDYDPGVRPQDPFSGSITYDPARAIFLEAYMGDGIDELARECLPTHGSCEYGQIPLMLTAEVGGHVLRMSSSVGLVFKGSGSMSLGAVIPLNDPSSTRISIDGLEFEGYSTVDLDFLASDIENGILPLPREAPSLVTGPHSFFSYTVRAGVPPGSLDESIGSGMIGELHSLSTAPEPACFALMPLVFLCLASRRRIRAGTPN